MMNASETNFVRNVVLSNDVPIDLKIGGLKILIDANKNEQQEIITNFDIVRQRNCLIQFGLTYRQWYDVQSAINSRRKIPAIKAIRLAVENFGLKEAKLAVEDDKFFRQPR